VSVGDSPVRGVGGAEHEPRHDLRQDLRELDDQQNDGANLGDLISSPVGGGAALGRLVKKFLGDGRSETGGPPGADSPTHWSRRAAGGGLSASTSSSLVREDAADHIARGHWTYPEWDVHRRRYRSDWCTVREDEEEPGRFATFDPPDARALRRSLSRLGVGLERRNRQLQGIDIDIDAAVDAQVDVAAGAAPEDGVYLDLLRRRRELAVLLLLDVSGSSGEPSPAGRNVHEHQRNAAAQLLIALHDAGDRVALYSFRSRGRTSVQVAPIKRFDDHLGTRVMQRLGASIPGGYTRLGAAIRHGTAVMEREAGTPRRLLVVLSDGFAYDHCYEGAYGEADARRALVEARHGGTGCLCLSIGAAVDAVALRRVFGSAAHAALPRTEQLPSVVGPLFRFALGSAEAQRRLFQRTTRTRERLQLERRPG
jgi:nitric oxide reductase NorD protein